MKEFKKISAFNLKLKCQNSALKEILKLLIDSDFQYIYIRTQKSIFSKILIPKCDDMNYKDFMSYLNLLKRDKFIDNIEITSSCTLHDKEEILEGLQYLQDEFIEHLDYKYFVPEIEKKKLKSMFVRQDSPPLEAYEYKAFSKLNIKPSNRDYGLLFE